MLCPKCNNTIDDNNVVCQFCGNVIQNTNSNNNYIGMNRTILSEQQPQVQSPTPVVEQQQVIQPVQSIQTQQSVQPVQNTNQSNNKIRIDIKSLAIIIIGIAITAFGVYEFFILPAQSTNESMEKARKNTFYTKASEICKMTQNIYNMDLLENKVSHDVSKCYSLDDLKNSGYASEDLKNFSGSVQVSISGDGALETIWLSDKNYQITKVDCKKLSTDVIEKRKSNASNNCR